MVREFRPLKTCLEELRQLIRTGGDGTFYLAGVDNEIAAITLGGGFVEAVNFRGHRGDAAVDQIKALAMARASFHPGPTRRLRQTQLSDHSVDWLTGAGRDAPASPSPRPAPAAPPPPAGAVPSGAQRKAIETIACAYLGPVAPAVCDAAFADHADLGRIIEEIAANLPTEEIERFLGEVGRAIDGR